MLHPVQVVSLVEQAAQGKVQSSHTLLKLFPYFPRGHEREHVEAVRKYGDTQAVQFEAEPAHFLHEDEQLLHIQSVLSPHSPSGQEARHVPLLRKKLIVQNLQVVAAPEQ
jgi:hypothetical protein